MYEYKFKVTRVIDASTVEGVIDLGFDTHRTSHVVLKGIDPSPSSWSDMYPVHHRRAKDRLEKLLEISDIIIQSHFVYTDPLYLNGVVSGTLYTINNAGKKGLNVNRHLLDEGFAIEKNALRNAFKGESAHV
jgi:hypothetical protein